MKFLISLVVAFLVLFSAPAVLAERSQDSDINKNDPSIPPAKAVMQVYRRGDTDRWAKIVLRTTESFSEGKVVVKMIGPTGEGMTFIARPFASPSAQHWTWEIWEGNATSYWAEGPYTFEATFEVGGNLSRVSATVQFNCDGCAEIGPDFGIVASNGNVTIAGKFVDPQVMVDGTVPRSVKPTGEVDLPYRVPRGQHVITVCDGGTCTSRSFYAP